MHYEAKLEELLKDLSLEEILEHNNLTDLEVLVCLYKRGLIDLEMFYNDNDIQDSEIDD